MIRFLNAYFPARTILLGVSEALLIAVAFAAATFARLGASDANIVLSYQQGYWKILIVAGIFITCMYYFDLYDSIVLRSKREVLTRLIQVLGTVCVVLAVLYYAFPLLQLGRGIFIIGFGIVAFVLLGWRRLFLALNSLPQFAERALILGDGPLSEPLLRELQSRPELGLRVVGCVAGSTNGTRAKAARNPGPEHDADELMELVGAERVQRIIVAMGDRRGKLPVESLLAMKSRGVAIQDGIELYEAVTGKVPIESLRLGWLLFSPGFHISKSIMFYKRSISLLVSSIGLLICLPILPFICLAIKLTSPGPILYKQKRVGKDGVVFDCYKFRTMRSDAEADTGPTWAGDNDPRITKVGKFLRKCRLDEIPQLWNVLRGDMSLVGPRPERPEFVAMLSEHIPHYQLRHFVRPGLSGWAQIRYNYGSSIEDAKEKLRYDLFYMKNISPGLDILILFDTIKIILLGRGAR